MAEGQEGISVQSLGGRGEEKEEYDYDLIVEKQARWVCAIKSIN